MPDQDKFNEWCILELMGHRRLYGRVTEQELGGTNMLRVDIFGTGSEALATQFYSAAAVYCITPTTEEICRVMGGSARPEPVKRWEMPSEFAHLSDEELTAEIKRLSARNRALGVDPDDGAVDTDEDEQPF